MNRKQMQKRAFLRLGKAIAEAMRRRALPLPQLPQLPKVPTQLPRAELPLHPALPKIAPKPLPEKMVPTMPEIPAGQGGVGPNREVILSDKMQELQRKMQFAHLFNEGVGPKTRIEHKMGKALWVLQRQAKQQGLPFTDADALRQIEQWRAGMTKKSRVELHLYLLKSAVSSVPVSPPSPAMSVATPRPGSMRATWSTTPPTTARWSSGTAADMQPGRLSQSGIDQLHDQMDFNAHTFTDEDFTTPQVSPTQAPVASKPAKPKAPAPIGLKPPSAARKPPKVY